MPARISTLLAFAICSLISTSSLAQNRWEEMDYGPFISSSVTMFGAHPEKPEGITLKGVTVKLADGKAAVCFDTDTLRYSAGWTGGWLKLMGTPFDGTHRPPEGSRPAPKGTEAFSNSKVAGWARGDEAFSDPRKSPYGPVPRSYGRYNGLYVHEDQVVFSYTIGDCTVLDMPACERAEAGQWVFSRTIRMGPSMEPLTMLVCERAGAKGSVTTPEAGTDDAAREGAAAHMSFAHLGDVVASVTSVPKGTTWKVTDGRLALALPPLKESIVFKVLLGTGGKPDLPSVAELRGRVTDPQRFTKGGPARYKQIVETRGTVGKGEGAYVVDTLTLPDDNPWKAWMRVGGFDFYRDGRAAALCTWSGDVWTVAGIDDDLDRLEWKRAATGLFQPLGLKIVDEQIYVLGRDQITRLHDFNRDGEADYYENFNNDVEVTPNFHEFQFDLHTDAAGNFYYTKGAPLLGTHFWDPIGKHNGCALRVSKDGGQLDVFATGLRAPNGSSVGPNGEMTCSDNQGIWTPVCRINLMKEGGFYGAVGLHHAEQEPQNYDPPICWLPFDVDNSSGGQVWVTSDNWGLPRASLLHLSYGKCRLFHVLWERAGDGTPQGGVARFDDLRFESGVMRGRFNPADGQLYVAGLRGWQTDAARDGCLQRVRYTGKPLRRPVAMKVTHDGIDITFTQSLSVESARDVDNYSAERWQYLWSKEYGSPQFKYSKPSEQGTDVVDVVAATLSHDGKTVSLKLADMRPVMQLKVGFTLEFADGTEVEQQVYATVNRVP